MQTQLDLFEEYSEMKALIEHTNSIEKQVNNVRRGLFSRLGNVFKTLISHADSLSALEVKVDRQEREIRELKETISWMESVA